MRYKNRKALFKFVYMRINQAKILLVVLWALFTKSGFAQVNITITSVPNNTPLSDTLYIAGSFNNWQAANSLYILRKVGNVYQITLPAGTGTASFKFTRGTWATVEGNSAGGFIPNRTFTYSPNLNLNLSIAGWEDKPSSGGSGSTAIANVKIISDTFYMPQLQRKRRVWIYLPNSYETNTANRYPVLYLQDGQNLFDQKTSFSGEWSVDETLSNLQKLGDPGCIVVGIDNGGSKRIDEYSPYVNPSYGGGEGERYLDFLTQTLKPFIDSSYRTLPDANNTGIGGSSMGANIALYASVFKPNIFGKAMVFSPAFWFSDSLFKDVSKQKIESRIKVYMVAGTNESSTMVPYMLSMDSALKAKGIVSYESKVLQHTDGAHSEWYWKREFGAAYQWLFEGAGTSVENAQKSRMERATKMDPNPADDFTEIRCFHLKSLLVLDAKGNKVFETNPGVSLYKLDVSNFPNGMYYVQVEVSSQIKFVKTLLVQHK